MPDKEYDIQPLTFEKGLNESLEPSMLPVGTVQLLQNWESSPTGELRSRVRWSKGTTTGTPDTRKVKGIGYFSRVILPSIVQESAWVSADTGATTAATVEPEWTVPTQGGNLLILLLVVGNAVGIPDSGITEFTLAESETGADPSTRIYYWENAPSQSGSMSIAWTAISNNEAVAAKLIEVAGIATASSLDKTASAFSASDTSVETGTTAATAQAVEFSIALAGINEISNSFDSWTNGYTELDEGEQSGSGYPIGFGCAYKVLTAAAAQSTVATLGNAAVSTGCIATFKGWYTGATPSVPSVQEWVVAHDNSEFDTQQSFYALDRDSLAAGTWSAVMNVTMADPDTLTAFAPGLGRLWITNENLGSVFYYDGSTIDSVTGSPAGGKCIAVHKNRVWTTSANAPGRLWFSDLNDPITWPGDNYIDVLAQSGEVIEDITPALDALVIGTRTSLWLLSGSGPDTFNLTRLPAGGVAPGRTLITTPYGIVAAGRKYVWLITGDSAVSLASRPVQDTYALSGDWFTCSYINDQVYICDEGTGATYALNLQTGTWRVETFEGATELPSVIHNHDELQVYGPLNATVGSLLNYRELPAGSSRGKDFDTLTEVFKVTTPEYWFGGPEFCVTPRHLFIKYRQHSNNAGADGPLYIVPRYDGADSTTLSVPLQDTAGVYRVRKDLGDKQGVSSVKFTFQLTMQSAQTAAIDIEEVAIGFNYELVR